MLYIHFLIQTLQPPYEEVLLYFTKYNSDGDILLTQMCLISKPIILSLCATFIVGYLKQLFFLSSDSSTQCSSCSSPPRAQVFLHRHPSSQARGEGMTGHHVAKTLKQPVKTKLWEEQPASHKHPAILCQPCVQATWDLGPPAPGQPSEGCNLLKDPEPWQLSYATLEYLMCRNYKDTKCLFFKVC